MSLFLISFVLNSRKPPLKPLNIKMVEPSINNIDVLYRRYVNDLLSYALYLGFDRETSKDAIHDVFYKICLDRDLLNKINNIRFYLLRALKNRLLDIHKQKKDISEISMDNVGDELPFIIRVTIEDDIIQSEEDEKTRKQIEDLLNNLTDRQREIIYLRYSQECDYEQIAQLMDITVPACRKLSHKAITKLRQSHLPFYLSILFMG